MTAVISTDTTAKNILYNIHFINHNILYNTLFIILALFVILPHFFLPKES